MPGGPTAAAPVFNVTGLVAPLLAPNKTITGVSRDSTGVALGGCTVVLFNSATYALVAQMVSDGAGNFSFATSDPGPFFLWFYKAGSPDVAASSVNTIVAL